ncbi:MAG: hypothetical protein VX706_02645 [Bacteroidota bacterium]|nr:hypothetical protein [Bacteroidota bacterium]
MKNKIFIVFISFFGACNLFINQDSDQKGIIAKVGDAYLYDDDIIYNSSLGDSAVLYNRQVNSWIKKQLLLNSAFQNESVMNQIERKVEDYKESLILFEFEKYLYANSIDFKISEDEISKYYNENKDDFILPFNLIKAIYAKVPIDAPSLNVFRNNLKKYPESDTAEVISYCFQFAEKSFLEDTTWIKFDDIILNLPFPKNLDKSVFLKTRKFYEIREGDFIHFIRILDKKLIGDYSPLSFEEDIVNTILLNNRKQELFDNLRDSIFNNSVRGVDYEIY